MLLSSLSQASLRRNARCRDMSSTCRPVASARPSVPVLRCCVVVSSFVISSCMFPIMSCLQPGMRWPGNDGGAMDDKACSEDEDLYCRQMSSSSFSSSMASSSARPVPHVPCAPPLDPRRREGPTCGSLSALAASLPAVFFESTSTKTTSFRIRRIFQEEVIAAVLLLLVQLAVVLVDARPVVVRVSSEGHIEVLKEAVAACEQAFRL